MKPSMKKFKKYKKVLILGFAFFSIATVFMVGLVLWAALSMLPSFGDLARVTEQGQQRVTSEATRLWGDVSVDCKQELFRAWGDVITADVMQAWYWPGRFTAACLGSAHEQPKSQSKEWGI